MVATEGGRVHFPQRGAAYEDRVRANEVLFDSEVAADTYSLAMAKKWIDDNS